MLDILAHMKEKKKGFLFSFTLSLEMFAEIDRKKLTDQSAELCGIHACCSTSGLFLWDICLHPDETKKTKTTDNTRMRARAAVP